MNEEVCLDDSADIFANSSAETVAEVSLADLSSEDVSRLDKLAEQLSLRRSNSGTTVGNDVISPTVENIRVHSSDTSFVLANFLAEAYKPPERIFCPFCAADFGFEFLLKSHIKETHLSILHKILKSAPDQVEYHECPFCDAKFYMKELLPRHILNKHQQSVMTMMDAISDETDQAKCLFCPHRVYRRHYPLMTVHIKKKHFKEFENYVIKKYTKIAASCDDLRFLGESHLRITTQIVTPGLSRNMACLSTQDDKVIYSRKPVFIKPILKMQTACNMMSPDSDGEALLSSPLFDNSPASLELFSDRVSVSRAAKQSCRRLRFDLPDSPPQLGGAKKFVQEKMRLAFAKKEKRFKWKFSGMRKGNVKKQENTSLLINCSPRVTPIKSSFLPSPTKSPESPTNLDVAGVMRYACCACNERFTSNALLVQHIRKWHRRLVLFKSLYGCGECDAKFYRNDPLVRHSAIQHSPLCLKPRTRKSPISVKF